MIIGSSPENKQTEKRVAITPDIVKKYKSLGFEIHLIKNYAVHLGFNDSSFNEVGAKIVNDENELIKKNRLELLNLLCKSFDNFFNFSKIEG